MFFLILNILYLFLDKIDRLLSKFVGLLKCFLDRIGGKVTIVAKSSNKQNNLTTLDLTNFIKVITGESIKPVITPDKKRAI